MSIFRQNRHVNNYKDRSRVILFLFVIGFLQASILIAGCSHLRFSNIPISEQERFERLIKSGHFKKALIALKTSPPIEAAPVQHAYGIDVGSEHNENGEKKVAGAESTPLNWQSKRLLFPSGDKATHASLMQMAKDKMVEEIAQAQALAEKKQWSDGLRLLRASKLKMPEQLALHYQATIEELEAQSMLYIDKLEAEAKIEYGQWVVKQAQLYRGRYQGVVSQNSLSGYWAQLQLNRWKGRQQKVADELLGIADKSLLKEDYLIANRVYGTLSSFELAPELEERFVQLGYVLLKRVEVNIAEYEESAEQQISKHEIVDGKQYEGPYPSYKERFTKKRLTASSKLVDEWVAQVNTLMREGRLVETQQLLNRLQNAKLSSAQKKKVQAATRHLQEQIKLLDKHADDLYRRGKVFDAHSVWALLLKLNKDNDTVKIKYYRSKKVLGNMQQLREEGFYSGEPL